MLVGTGTENARVRRALTDVVYTPGRGDRRNVADMQRVIEGLSS